jgi:hypothetical protein
MTMAVLKSLCTGHLVTATFEQTNVKMDGFPIILFSSCQSAPFDKRKALAR